MSTWPDAAAWYEACAEAWRGPWSAMDAVVGVTVLRSARVDGPDSVAQMSLAELAVLSYCRDARNT